jgi:hypothetical protein
VSVTAQKIRDISDAGEFEILAIRALRELDPDCAPLIHLGINSVGKTIVSPIDGFARVPGSNPSKYVTAAFTTVASNKLEQKWLNAGIDTPATSRGRKRRATGGSARASEPGDLIKAEGAAAKLRVADPTAKFIVYLCTNQSLSDEIMQKALAAAQQLNVEVRFLEQTRLRDFLDTKPEGQWLRREHLGIEADQVSLDLLKDATAASLVHYSKSMLLLWDEKITATEQIEDILNGLQDRALTLQLLVGSSGIGKSVIGLAAHRMTIKTGRIAFWISEQVVENAISLSDALDMVLRSIHPNLLPGAGLNALQIGSAEWPVIIIIDDINRTAAPASSLQKVIRWARPQPQGQQTTSPESMHQIVCPVWPSYWAMIHNRELRGWARVSTIKPFSRAEATQYLRSVLTPSTGLLEGALESAADILKNDPILLALFADTMLRNPHSNPLAVSQNVIGVWSRDILRELSEKTFVPVTTYQSSLGRLAAEMIRRRILRPKLSDLEGWFTGGDIHQQILQVAEAGHLCSIQGFQHSRSLEFRHDRILEFFLSGALTAMLANSETDEAAWDPFFTPFLGRAIAKIPLAYTVLDSIQDRNPVAFIAALPFLDPSNSGYGDEIKRRAREWLRAGQGLRNHAWYHSLSLLREITSPAVIEVTDAIAGNPIVYQARLRNGDAKAAIRELLLRFWPGVNAPWLEGMIAQARHYHESEMVDSLSEILVSDTTDDLRYGALVLAGYLGRIELTNAIATCWSKSSNKTQIVVPALWGTLRCADKNLDKIVPSIFATILQLEHDPTGKSYSPRYHVLQELGFAGRHGYRKEGLYSLLKIGESEEHVGSVMAIVAELMEPIVVPYVVQRLAEYTHSASQSGGFSPFAHSWIDHWRRWRDQGQVDTQCIFVLQQIWMNKKEAEWVREYAFQAWNTATTDLTTLQLIDKTDAMYENAIWYRMREGDRSATAAVLELLPRKPFWFRYISDIWSDDLEDVLHQHIEHFVTTPPASTQSNADYDLAQLLRDIPEDRAGKILMAYGSELKRRPLFVQLALYLANEESRSLAADAINDLGGEVFVHIDFFFGINTVGLADRLRLKHFESLAPYLHYLSDMTISEMIDWCGKSGNLGWAKTNLLPEYQRRRSTVAEDHRIISHSVYHWLASQAEVFEELDEIASGNSSFQAFHLERMSEHFVERGNGLGAFCTDVKNWFLAAPSGGRFALLATVIQNWGQRSDLPFLESMYSAYASEPLLAFSDLKFSVERRSID